MHVPSSREDSPSWIKVGVIAAIGFAVGIAWPRLAGIRLGPPPPEAASSPAAGSSAAREQAASSSAPAPGSTSTSASANAPLNAAGPTLSVSHGVVVSCKNDDGQPLHGSSSCGAFPAFDAYAVPRLKKLAQCAAAESASGKLPIVLDADFDKATVTATIGRGATVTSPEPILLCLRATLQGERLPAMEHARSEFGVLYTLTFEAPSEQPAPSVSVSTSDSSDGASAVATVTWETALVRDTPKTGSIVARLPRGSKLKIGQPKDGWYPVKYGASFGSDGFVYRGAIGK